jgi:hypothetical protein
MDLLRFHWVETVVGLGIAAFAAFGVISLWLLPTAICLALAAPFAWLLALNARKWPLFGFGTVQAGVRGTQFASSRAQPVLRS